MATRPGTPRPALRRLRHYTFDPILSRKVGTSGINEVVTGLPWEDTLQPGPKDDYIEVVDYDPASGVFYAPVDLNDKFLLAQDGLMPSESNPQFHQQMAYAVARTTINNFERALGRRALWSPRSATHEVVDRLRIYPHALREGNAYYSPDKKALLFGYFPASMTDSGDNMPGETVFACLSYDVVAHETTHALLDGVHPRFNEASNVDVLALHEAFADIVALFQHFSYPESLRHQIAATAGNLEKQNLLGKLAYQFGQAIGRYGALRDAIGKIDPATNEWVPEVPKPEKLLQTFEPHDRGAILVAAVFEAFLTIYKSRAADLLRIASGGSGILPAGELHPDLVDRLAKEAAKAADHVLQICIRAMDYCTPLDPTFGDYLRALITADKDLVADDNRNYRLAFMEAFRRRGIYPAGVRNFSEESLLWDSPEDRQQTHFQSLFTRESLHNLVPDWELTSREPGKIYQQANEKQGVLHAMLAANPEAARAARIILDEHAPGSFFRDKNGKPTFEIHSIRPVRRIGPREQTLVQLVIEITQRRRGYYSEETQKKVDSGQAPIARPDFIFRGGCTLILDPDCGGVRYCIYKNILSQNRLAGMRAFLNGDDVPSLRATYFGDLPRAQYRAIVSGIEGRQGRATYEPFALLHRS